MPDSFSLQVNNLNIVGEIYFPPKSTSRLPAVIICHGIPAVVHDPTDRGYADLAGNFSGNGFIACIFNFRGAGKSEGNLDLLHWTRDLDAVITHVSLLDEVDSSRISVMGFSGGAAASAYTAARDQRIASLVLCACPSDLSVLTEQPRLQEFLEHCRDIGTIKNASFPPNIQEWADHFLQINPIDWIAKISPRPLLIIHGDKDDLIEPAHAKRLYDKANEPKELVIIPDGEHRLRTNEMAMEIARVWLKKNAGIS